MKLTKYPPIGEALTIESAAVQAAYALDSSASIAESQRDQAGMLAVGEAWMKLADFLAALQDAEDKKPEKKQTKVPLGFQPPTVEKSDNDDDDEETLEEKDDDVRSDDDDGADEGSDCTRLHREHGKLRIPPR